MILLCAYFVSAIGCAAAVTMEEILLDDLNFLFSPKYNDLHFKLYTLFSI